MLDADVLQRMVSDACTPHACGFGRLGAIVGAVGRGLHPLSLIPTRTPTRARTRARTRTLTPSQVDRSFHPVAPAAALE